MGEPWPDEAFAAVVRLKDAFPDWWITWWWATKEIPQATGYWAAHRHRLEHRTAYGATEVKLALAIREADEQASTR